MAVRTDRNGDRVEKRILPCAARQSRTEDGKARHGAQPGHLRSRPEDWEPRRAHHSALHPHPYFRTNGRHAGTWTLVRRWRCCACGRARRTFEQLGAATCGDLTANDQWQRAKTIQGLTDNREKGVPSHSGMSGREIHGQVDKAIALLRKGHGGGAKSHEAAAEALGPRRRGRGDPQLRPGGDLQCLRSPQAPGRDPHRNRRRGMGHRLRPRGACTRLQPCRHHLGHQNHPGLYGLLRPFGAEPTHRHFMVGRGDPLQGTGEARHEQRRRKGPGPLHRGAQAGRQRLTNVSTATTGTPRGGTASSTKLSMSTSPPGKIGWKDWLAIGDFNTLIDEGAVATARANGRCHALDDCSPSELLEATRPGGRGRIDFGIVGRRL